MTPKRIENTVGHDGLIAGKPGSYRSQKRRRPMQEPGLPAKAIPLTHPAACIARKLRSY
ncbi:hypothetical protein C4K29_4909 [Pseudomonas chlororaphis subsp. piscium]|nr:hypothetical protein C4K29_4909 [Pseudomonas chlororaphis subsp. piscium]